MGRRREWAKRLRRTAWLATYRASRCGASGAAHVESVFVVRRGRSRVVRFECVWYRGRIRVTLSDELTPALKLISAALRAMAGAK